MRAVKTDRRSKMFKEEMILDAFELAMSGCSKKRIADTLGVSITTFDQWAVRHPIIFRAIERGREYANKHKGPTFADYVFDKLDESHQFLWEDVCAAEKSENAKERVEKLLCRAGTRARQHIFFYAWTYSNFNMTEACRKANVNKRTLDVWMKDPEFVSIVDEITFHKKNFFENALHDLIAMRKGPAVIFANRTFNADRGYGAKVKVEHSGTINHAHLIDLEQTPISLETRRRLLAEIKEHEQKQKLLAYNPDDIIDAEFSINESEDDDE